MKSAQIIQIPKRVSLYEVVEWSKEKQSEAVVGFGLNLEEVTEIWRMLTLTATENPQNWFSIRKVTKIAKKSKK
tara:strand:- start:13 stop:234 length:222 start_codon:yes stop_codon:yes gene_type:complete